MNRSFPLFVMAVCLPALQAAGQVITPRGDREVILKGMGNVILNTEKEVQSYADVPSPFLDESAAAESDRQTPVEPGLEEETEVAAPEPVVLPDAVALERIAERFRPVGSMVIGERGVLQLASGRTIEQGASFRADIRGTCYKVHLESVTSSGYRLRLDSATVEKSFIETKTGQSR